MKQPIWFLVWHVSVGHNSPGVVAEMKKHSKTLVDEIKDWTRLSLAKCIRAAQD